MRKSEALNIRKLIEKAAESLSDTDAVHAKMLYPKWVDLIGTTAENAGFKFQHGGNLYKTAQSNHTFQADWKPDEGTESLYTRIDEAHAGSITDPIPYSGNMELEKDLYYTQNEKVYKCTTATGQAVFHALDDLVGLYVEEA